MFNPTFALATEAAAAGDSSFVGMTLEGIGSMGGIVDLSTNPSQVAMARANYGRKSVSAVTVLTYSAMSVEALSRSLRLTISLGECM